MWGDEMQLQITSNMHKIQINVLKVSTNGDTCIREINPDPRVINKEDIIDKNNIWLMLKDNHYDTLVSEDSPLVTGSTEHEQTQCKSKEGVKEKPMISETKN